MCVSRMLQLEEEKNQQHVKGGSEFEDKPTILDSN